jgi:hypothetical protein
VLASRSTLRGNARHRSQSEVGQILAESAIEVFATKADRYAHINTFGFERVRYSGACGKRKKIRLLAPLAMCPSQAIVELVSASKALPLPSSVLMTPNQELRVGIAEFVVRLPDAEAATTIQASSLGTTAFADSIVRIWRNVELD